jgi:hypothetical protein
MPVFMSISADFASKIQLKNERNYLDYPTCKLVTFQLQIAMISSDFAIWGQFP